MLRVKKGEVLRLYVFLRVVYLKFRIIQREKEASCIHIGSFSKWPKWVQPGQTKPALWCFFRVSHVDTGPTT